VNRTAYNITQHSKPFSVGAFLKQCVVDVAEEVCLQSKTLFENVSLSRKATVC
jgi:hypothetical protein